MKIGKRNDSVGDGGGHPLSDVTKETFVERACYFLSCRDGFVIRGFDGDKGESETKQRATDAEWIAWLRYFEAKGIPTAFMRKHGEATVPCRWPEDFDQDARGSDQGARLVRWYENTQSGPRVLPDHLRPKDLGEAARGPRRGRTTAAEQIEALGVLETLADRNAKPIAPLSDTARATMGLPPLRIEAAE